MTDTDNPAEKQIAARMRLKKRLAQAVEKSRTDRATEEVKRDAADEDIRKRFGEMLKVKGK